MCWLCAGDNPTLASNVHGDTRTITTSVLQDAADQAGITVPEVVSGLVKALGTINLATRASKPIEAEYAACCVIKAEAEHRYSLGLAYPAMRLDKGVAADGHTDFVSADVLEKTAWRWMADHRDINLFHKDGTSGHAQVVESYIYRGPDWKIASPIDGESYVVKAGDWMLGTVWDSHGWDLVKRGLIQGWSPEGGAKRSRPSAERLAELRV